MEEKRICALRRDEQVVSQLGRTLQGRSYFPHRGLERSPRLDPGGENSQNATWEAEGFPTDS